MKTKKILFLFALLSSTMLFSQQGYYYDNYGNENELKFNIGWFLADATAEFSFEHFINDEASIGATVYFDAESTDSSGSFGIGPNFRGYFGRQPRSGLFVEGFALYYTGEEDIVVEDPSPDFTNNFSTFALGVGVGHKWTTLSDQFSVEFNLGVGRNVNPKDFQEDFIGRAALSIGFRF